MFFFNNTNDTNNRPTNTNNLSREFHAKRCQTHKNVISHFAIEMFSLSSNYIGDYVPKKISNGILFL